MVRALLGELLKVNVLDALAKESNPMFWVLEEHYVAFSDSLVESVLALRSLPYALVAAHLQDPLRVFLSGDGARPPSALATEPGRPIANSVVACGAAHKGYFHHRHPIRWPRIGKGDDTYPYRRDDPTQEAPKPQPILFVALHRVKQSPRLGPSSAYRIGFLLLGYRQPAPQVIPLGFQLPRRLRQRRHVAALHQLTFDGRQLLLGLPQLHGETYRLTLLLFLFAEYVGGTDFLEQREDRRLEYRIGE